MGQWQYITAVLGILLLAGGAIIYINSLEVPFQLKGTNYTRAGDINIIKVKGNWRSIKDGESQKPEPKPKVDLKTSYKYTPTSEEVCNGDKCNSAIFLTMRFADENGTKIEHAKSLKDCQFCDNIKLIISEDNEYPVDIIDYNLTNIHLKLRIGHTKHIGKNIDLEVYNKYNKSIKYYSSYRRINKLSDTRTVNLPFGFDKEVSWGENSTTLQLNFTTGSGYVHHQNVMGTWSNCHDATTGTSASAGFGPRAYGNCQTIASGCDYPQIFRGFMPLNTSSIPDDVDIDSAVFWFNFTSVYQTDNDGQDYVVIVGNTTQSSDTTLSTSDFNDCGAIDDPANYSNTLDVTDLTIDVWTNTSLNAFGIDAINKTGITRFGLREGHDAEDNAYIINSGFTGVIAGTGSYLNVTYGVNTCTAPGTSDWEIDLADDCNIDDEQDVNNYNIVTYGTCGSLTFNDDARILNVRNFTFFSDCIYFVNGFNMTIVKN